MEPYSADDAKRRKDKFFFNKRESGKGFNVFKMHFEITGTSYILELGILNGNYMFILLDDKKLIDSYIVRDEDLYQFCLPRMNLVYGWVLRIEEKIPNLDIFQSGETIQKMMTYLINVLLNADRPLYPYFFKPLEPPEYIEEKDKQAYYDYNKRVKELIDKAEKEKDGVKNTSVGEAQLLEAQELQLKTAKSIIHPYFRNVKIILVFTYAIRDYYKRRADSTEKNQFREEIDPLYKLIFEELKKSSQFIHDYPNRTQQAEFLDKRRILRTMGEVLGPENLNEFYRKYCIYKLIYSASSWEFKHRKNIFVQK